MKNRIKISIIIPSYLEEENLRIIGPRIISILDELKEKYEVLVIDTMKPMDRTSEVCEKLGIKYFNRNYGNNYGDAVRTGIQNAKGDYIIFMDADGSHSPEFIRNLYAIHADYDVVIASRYIDGGSSDNNRLLKFMSLTVNVLYSVFLGLKCKDVSNSFKLYRAELLKNIVLKCNNFDIVEEILFKLQKTNKNLKIKEIPFTFKERMFGHTKRNLFLFVISYAITIIRLRFIK